MFVTVNVKVTFVPAGKLCGAAVSARARSAAGFTVALALAVLFAVLGSGSVAETVPVFAIVPVVVGFSTIVTMATPPFGRVPSGQLNVDIELIPHVAPAGGVAPTNVTPAGSVSPRTTFVAGDGPLFVTVKV